MFVEFLQFVFLFFNGSCKGFLWVLICFDGFLMVLEFV